jgi:hypothetical protein
MSAPVHVGISGGSGIVNDFYRLSARESIGPALIETETNTRAFTTLEELVDHLAASNEQTHVIVNHGSPTQGLLIKFTANSPHNATGLVAQALSALVAAQAAGTLPIFDPALVNVAAQMGITPFETVQLLAKLVPLRSRNLLLHFRGCNLGGNTSLLNGYKLLFGAVVITAPNCRMFYLRIRPAARAAASILAMENQPPSTTNTRRRVFRPSGNNPAGPLLVDVRDIDGHTNVDSPLSLAEQPAAVPSWGELLTGRWSGTGAEFVLPVLWNDTEGSFHCPVEVGYRQRLTTV